jgi:hypothetical protein
VLNNIRVSKLVQIACVVAFGAALLSAGSLSEDKALVTFDRPVEVPGKVLPPGSYVFKSLEKNELVQVFSANEKQLFATISVIPEDRPAQNVDSDCFVQLNKTRSNAPQEVEGLFLPGRTTGFQFVYPAPQLRHR